MVRFLFADRPFVPLGCGALFWPERGALLVADLHLEKASHYARRGAFLPPYDSEETVGRIEAAVALTAADEVWCLGDSWHDGDGAGRLPGAVRARLARLIAATAWTWITGNHDPAADPLGAARVDEARVDGIALRHVADPAAPGPEISGHFHPKLRIHARGRSLARRCFVRAGAKLVLPAYGALAGGLDADHPEIAAAVGRPATALVATAERVLSFPLR